MSSDTIKLKRGQSGKLSSLPISSGSMIITTDTNELYVDVNSSRNFIGQVQIVDSLPASNISTSRLYFLTTNNTVYKYTNSTWMNVTNVLMTGATSSAPGKAGMVPAPTSSDVNKFLRGDGTWSKPEETVYSTASPTSDGLMSSADKVKLDSIEDGATNTSVSIVRWS